ncbi:hypothetical protein MS3_00003978 [Schistosoma haematobium]|uniref:Uncharacterized protein n=2 Tax=Schistosoma haematobium TaxID=6185 RepID=A0A922LUF8_SCHHA|nr:hypothetical protein MS3_00003978 [Schistosoma haematobium]KAH9594115.1 hypothetical protein MS3_00003978 [Schistosoma haematobium]CAH8438072.1 unnamed protein product [Schistosoma haematobium]CAH8438651.1 unnamed protein product [Schistosoma haematobium]
MIILLDIKYLLINLYCNMKFILVLSLLVLVTLVFVEARPEENKEFLLRKMLSDTTDKLKVLTLKHLTIVRNKVKNYFKEDGLGEKIAEVLVILIKRLNKRLENCLESSNLE